MSLAVDTWLMRATLRWNGCAYDVFAPPQYYGTGMDTVTLEQIVSRGIVEETGHKIARLGEGS